MAFVMRAAHFRRPRGVQSDGECPLRKPFISAFANTPARLHIYRLQTARGSKVYVITYHHTLTDSNSCTEQTVEFQVQPS